MSAPKVFQGTADAHLPLEHHAQGEVQAKSPSRKRSADTLESLTPRQKKARTDALERERQRYEKLKADPLCHVSPTCGQAVQCDRCGSHIKLSDKNNYDAQHWTKHRRLCVKRPDAVAAAMRAESDLGRRKLSCTPELTADTASESTRTVSASVNSEPAESREPSPTPMITAATPWLDSRRHHETHPLTAQILCQDYIASYHPGSTPVKYDSYQDLVEEMRAWSPSRLKLPACLDVPESEVDRVTLHLSTPAQWDENASPSMSPEEDCTGRGTMCSTVATSSTAP
ncbi:hypothetical protein C8Q77DRAFT_1161509 [Trametes polyzona]|nr:hypothetical protein C8Q77DRAFT_1161509 [Trametes polyzona]